MAKDYETKDGIVLRNVPDDVPDEQIKARIDQIRAEKISSNGGLQNVANQPINTVEPTKNMGDYEKRAYDIYKSDISSIEKSLQSTALGLEWIYDTAANKISDFVGEKPKKYIKNTLISMGEAAKPALNTPIGKAGIMALQSGSEQWSKFKEEYPRFAKDLKAVGIVGSTALMGARPAASLTKKAIFRDTDYLYDLVHPLKLKNINLKNLRTQGLKGKAIIVPDNKAGELVNTLKGVPGVKAGQSPARIYEYAGRYNATLAKELKDKLEKSGKSVSSTEVNRTLEKAANSFNKQYDKSKRLTKKERFEFIDDALDRIGSPSTTAELLDARKAADQRFRFFSNDRRMKGELIPTREEMKWRSTRDSLNALLEMKEPGYKSEIRRQHLLYKAQDAIEDRVYQQIEEESKSFIERHLPKVTSVIMPRVAK